MVTKYERLIETRRDGADGIEVTLALQRRFSPGEQPWYTVSWRTRLRPGGPNRRFYMQAGKPWSIGSHLADEMLEELEHRGGLHEQYHDHLRRPAFHEVTAAALAPHDARRVFEEITSPEEDWGPEPFWVVLGEDRRDRPWRKTLLVDPSTGRATFRSTTRSSTYRPRAILRPGLDWVLDNSMQDCTVQQATRLWQQLRTLHATVAVPRWG